MNLKSMTSEKAVRNLFFAASVLLLLMMAAATLSRATWFDEAFSLELINNSFPKMIELAIPDVHPPLYYIILKIAVDTFGLLVPSLSENFVAKMVSLIPYILLAALSMTKIRRIWGDICGAVYMFCMLSMPQFMYYGIDIRMYSWSLFFVTLSYLYAQEIMNGGKIKIKSWVLFSLFSVLAAYTHYYACVAVAVIYAFLAVWLFFSDKKSLKLWLAFSLATIAAYAPWIKALVIQVSTVSGEYWISPVTIRCVLDYTYFVMGPVKKLGLIPLAACAGCAVLFFKTKPPKNIKWIAVLGITVLVGTAVIGTAVSIIVRPVFFHRYLFPSLGCFWFFFAIALGRVFETKKVFAMIICAAFLVTGFYNGYNFAKEEITYYRNLQEIKVAVEVIKDDDIIIANGPLLPGCVSYLTGQTVYYKGLDGKTFDEVQRVVLKHVENMPSIDEVNDLAGENSTIWLFKDPKFDENAVIDAEFEENGMSLTEIGRYEFEQAPFTLYRAERLKNPE